MVTNTNPLGFAHRAEWNAKSGRAKWLVSIIFLPNFALSVVYLGELVHFILLQNDSTFPEGSPVYTFLTVFHTGKLYSPPFQFPWNAEIYGPVFYLLGALLATIAHGDPLLTTIFGRLLSFGSYLASVAIVGRICWKLEKQKRWALIVVVLGLASAWAVPWVASVRPDAFSILLILGALYVYVIAEGRLRLIFLAGVVASLSWLTKQNTAPLLVALLVDCLISKKWKSMVALAAGSSPIPILLFGTLWLRHEPLLANFLISGSVVKNWHDVVPGVILSLRTNEVAVLPILLALHGAILNWQKASYRPILLAAIFGCASNVAALCNVGANTNYFILPWLLILPLVPAGLNQVEQWTTRRPWIPIVLLLVVTLILLHRRGSLLQNFPPDLDASQVSNVTMLSDSSYLEAQSREPQLLDPYFYGELSSRKVWSDAVILQRIDDEHYDLILMSGDAQFDKWAWGTDVRAEMEGHYRVLCGVDNRIALVPQHRVDSVQAEDLTRIFKEPCSATVHMPEYLGRG
jgi:hypothetical protein